MPDREKVIKGLKGLECCIDPLKAHCLECQYYPCYDQDTSSEKLIADALELLKEQEPRVLTLEEVQNDCPDYVYLEWYGYCSCCIKDECESDKSVVYFVYGIEDDYFQFSWDTYGDK